MSCFKFIRSVTCLERKKNLTSSKPVNACSLEDVVHRLYFSPLYIYVKTKRAAALLTCEQRECTVYFPEAVQVNLTTGYRPVS